MKLKALRAFFLQGGAIAQPGDIVEVPNVQARDLMSCQKAELAPDEVLPAYEPMTVENSPALVPGKPTKAGKGKT